MSINGGSAIRYRKLIARLLEMPLSRLGAGAGAVALATSGLFGGLDPATESTVPAGALNAVDSGVPWNVTVTGVRVVNGAQLPTVHLEKPTDRWVAVLATVEVTADETRSDLSEAVKISGVDGLQTSKPTYVYLLRDDVSNPDLHPGLPEKLAYLWEQTGSAAVPAKATVEIWGKTQREDSLTGHLEWLDPAVRARVTDVPVQDKR